MPYREADDPQPRRREPPLWHIGVIALLSFLIVTGALAVLAALVGPSEPSSCPNDHWVPTDPAQRCSWFCGENEVEEFRFDDHGGAFDRYTCTCRETW